MKRVSQKAGFCNVAEALHWFEELITHASKSTTGKIAQSTGSKRNTLLWIMTKTVTIMAYPLAPCANRLGRCSMTRKALLAKSSASAMCLLEGSTWEVHWDRRPALNGKVPQKEFWLAETAVVSILGCNASIHACKL